MSNVAVLPIHHESSIPPRSVPSPGALRGEWTLRVSSVEAGAGHTLVVRGGELVHVLTRLLNDDRVHDVTVAPRAREVRARVENAPLSPQISYGEIAIDAHAREVLVRGERVVFTRRELDLLAFLMRNPNRAWTREELLDRVWGSDDLEKRRTVDIHVRRVRAKLGVSATPLETLVGVGYRFSVVPPPLAPLVDRQG